MPHTDALLLGIDGGGSKTACWLARAEQAGEPTILGRGMAGASNAQAVGLPAALASLDAAVESAFADARVPSRTVAAAVIALAGSDRDENRRALGGWAQERRLAERFEIVHDAAPVLAAGSAEGWGIALISGTGSFAFGQDRQGRALRAGGWGYLFGDEGSAYWIAVAGLRAAAQFGDGRGESTMLLDHFFARLSPGDSDMPGAATSRPAGQSPPLALSSSTGAVRRPEDLITLVYRFAAERAAVASLAEVVFSAAADHDRVARQILRQAAIELAALVAAVARRLNLSGGEFPLALAGGMLMGSETIRNQLLADLARREFHPASVTLVTEPVAGAVRLAERALESAP